MIFMLSLLLACQVLVQHDLNIHQNVNNPSVLRSILCLHCNCMQRYGTLLLKFSSFMLINIDCTVIDNKRCDVTCSVNFEDEYETKDSSGPENRERLCCEDDDDDMKDVKIKSI